MREVTLTAQVTELGPLILLGSLPRTGTTLIQRLLNSASNTTVFGDPIGREVESFLGSVLTRWPSVVHGYQVGGRSEDVETFTAGFSPSPDIQLEAWRASLSLLVDGFFAAEEHREKSVKGWKLAGPTPSLLPHLVEWLPQARWILLQRPLDDCLRSAKAVGMVNGAESVSYWQQLDSENRAQFSALSGSHAHVMNLEYEEMISAPEVTIEALQSFTGCAEINPSIWAKRVNSIGRESYLSPLALSQEEEEAITLSRCA